MIKDVLERLYAVPRKRDIAALLALDDEGATEELCAFADGVRKERMGDGVLLRGIVEFSNVCDNSCAYCGLTRHNAALHRYTLTTEELLQSVGHVASCGIKTVVLQSGESAALDAAWLGDVIAEIKRRFDIAVTLSAGERPRKDFRLWRDAGADRYLLKIETTDKRLYAMLHAGMTFENRLRCLDDLGDLGYQVGSGMIVGLKGQTEDSIADDIVFFASRPFDMLGIGPFIPHRATALAQERAGGVLMTLKALALTRIVTKTAHLPATTALGSLGKDYRLEGLKAGANVLMPNFTPQPYRKMYEIYPGKRCVDEPAGACSGCMEGMAASIGRYIDYGRGDGKVSKKVNA